MATQNFPSALNFVWQPGFDNPRDGYHVTSNDPGGGTFGGITEATWAHAASVGTVSGKLADATLEQLGAVLRLEFWTPLCLDLPSGVDFLVFNGIMMTGHYPKLLQQSLGMMGENVDGVIGPATQVAAHVADSATLIDALSGAHYAYLATLSIWPEFGDGWTRRLQAAQKHAHLFIIGRA